LSAGDPERAVSVRSGGGKRKPDREESFDPRLVKIGKRPTFLCWSGAPGEAWLRDEGERTGRKILMGLFSFVCRFRLEGGDGAA
jgi:hypothetical protein